MSRQALMVMGLLAVVLLTLTASVRAEITAITGYARA